jgi:hypothetical protein
VIDKLEVRVPGDTPFHPDFSTIFAELRNEPSINPFRPSRHYQAVADLRPYSYDCIIHLHNRNGKYGNHKLELLDTSAMSLARMTSEIERLFEIHAARCDVTRLDVAADVPGVTVRWFDERVRVKYKQHGHKYIDPEQRMLGRGIQTIYYGKRPNLFRIYDKVAEAKYQYSRIRRRLGTGCESPSFQELFGFCEDAILTRVERQMGGGKLPPDIQVVADLPKLLSFNPFDTLELTGDGLQEPRPEDYDLTTYLAGMHLRHLVRQIGLQETRRFINRHSQRNGSWYFDKFHDFLPTNGLSFSEENLLDRFYTSLSRQLAVG